MRSNIQGRLSGFVVFRFLDCHCRSCAGRGYDASAIIKQRAVLGEVLLMTFPLAAMFARSFYLTIYFQIVPDTSTIGSGLRTHYVGAFTLSDIAVGTGMTRTGIHKPFSQTSTAIFAASARLSTLSLQPEANMETYVA